MINSSSSSNVIITLDDCNFLNSQVYTSSQNSTFSNTVQIKYMIPRCRACNHAHSQENKQGCYDVMMSSVAFVICSCKEHVPQDNLEYLEYLSKKKESL